MRVTMERAVRTGQTEEEVECITTVTSFLPFFCLRKVMATEVSFVVDVMTEWVIFLLLWKNLISFRASNLVLRSPLILVYSQLFIPKKMARVVSWHIASEM